MPWPETIEMNPRTQFAILAIRGDEPFSQLCDCFGISRPTGYKWLDRYREGGAANLAERSSARHSQSQQILPETAAALICLRQAHPSWGPRKLRQRLSDLAPSTAWPAASTIGDLLRRVGLSEPRLKPRRGSAPHKLELIAASAPNIVWSADFKGPFRTGDGVRCEPLTVSDGYSRYLLCCQALAQVTFAAVQPMMIRLFQTYGLPRALRTDNGNPFARRDGLGGLSRMSVWLLTLDIWPEFILPGRPDMNGRHERMHRVLKEDTGRPPAANLSEQQTRLDIWRVEYNTIRPHEALAQRYPDALYAPSARAYPSLTARWDYPADHQVRPVIGDGHIRWRDGTVYLSAALKGQTVGLAQRDDGHWTVRFRGFDLGVVDDATNRLRLGGRLSRTGGGGIGG